MAAEGTYISPYLKHSENLERLLQLEDAIGKKAPMTQDLLDLDDTPLIGAADATTFGSGIGVVIFLGSDRPEHQYAAQHLASRMSQPTEVALRALRRNVSFLFLHVMRVSSWRSQRSP